MSSCELCGKEFNFPYLLLRHLNKKNPCVSNNPFYKKVDNFNKMVDIDYKKVDNFDKKVDSKSKEFKCEKCSKVLKSKQGLQKHMKICNGALSLECPTCFRVFSDKSSKCRHIKRGKCTPVRNTLESIILEEENILLRKKVAMLEATKAASYSTSIVNNKTINNSITYNINYNPETKCLTTEDPMAPSSELLCFNGFKYEAAKSKLKDIDQDTLQQRIDNVRLKKDFYSLYSFFFRNVDNRRLHMFNLGKNNNTTHAQVFNNGAIEKMEKSQLFENVSKYIGQYLLNMSIENADVIYALTTEQASKTAFLEVTKDRSHTFDYFRGNAAVEDNAI